jgi:hypothetical protein
LGSISISSTFDEGLCPYLGNKEWANTPEARPSRKNVCYAQSRTRKKGFRKITVSCSSVSRKKQASTCLRSYSDCPYYQSASSEPSEDKAALHSFRHEDSAQPDPVTKPTTSRNRGRHISKLANSSKRRSHRTLSKKGRTAIQLGAVILASGIVAMGLSVLLSANPASFVEYLFQTVLLNDIKAFGLKHKDTKDRLSVGGMVTGGNLRSKKILSKSDKKRLKNSAIEKKPVRGSERTD